MMGSSRSHSKINECHEELQHHAELYMGKIMFLLRCLQANTMNITSQSSLFICKRVEKPFGSSKEGCFSACS